MGRPVAWSKERIVESLREWNVMHGRSPSSVDWRHASEDHPAFQTVMNRFGGWNAALGAAGLDVRLRRGDSGAVLAAVREVETYGVSQEEAARHFGVDQSSVSRRLSGTHIRR